MDHANFAPVRRICLASLALRAARWAGYLRFAPVPRLLDFSFPARCLQSPRGAHRLHSSAASPTVAGFAISGRLAAPI